MKQILINLSNTINSDLHLKIVSKEITITENKSDAICKKVNFKSTTNNIFAFSLDYDMSNRCKIFPYFNQSTVGINKVNDGIIFYIKNSEIYVLIIELKSTNLSDYKKQLQAGKIFVLYLLEILNNSFSKKYILKEKILNV